MAPRLNPFRPQDPVPPDMFVGRKQEVRIIETCLAQTVADRPSNFLITGERGIGKTSLMLYARALGLGQVSIDGTTANCLVVHAHVSSSTTQRSLLRSVEDDLRARLAQDEKLRKFLSDTWTVLQRVHVMDSGIREAHKSEDEQLFLEAFVRSLSATVRRVCPSPDNTAARAKYDAVLILIDEADNAAASMQLGAMFKLLSEGLQREGCSRVAIGVAGLPSVLDILHRSHPSALRLFQRVNLDRLSQPEATALIDSALSQANEVNQTVTSLSDEARQLILHWADGFPHFVQQFGFSAFDADVDGLIDADDVITGASGKHGAIELIGERHYRDDFYNRIQRESYREVLRIMADGTELWMTKAQIRAKFSGKERTLDNAIRALRNRHIILSREGKRGVYRLAQRGFALWLKIHDEGPLKTLDDPSFSPSSEDVGADFDEYGYIERLKREKERNEHH